MVWYIEMPVTFLQDVRSVYSILEVGDGANTLIRSDVALGYAADLQFAVGGKNSWRSFPHPDYGGRRIPVYFTYKAHSVAEVYLYIIRSHSELWRIYNNTSTYPYLCTYACMYYTHISPSQHISAYIRATQCTSTSTTIPMLWLRAPNIPVHAFIYT